ncbi:MAG: 1-acyl-sn-glycerol-3-phosphate acyltransferase [Bacteriovoracaceae bacterium]|nr:1-acyl-sn-glycerol-3-phosphate acyltransferase [Bacteriovoracaceae bacterium]
MSRLFVQVLAQIWASLTLPIVFVVLVLPVTLVVIPLPLKYRLRVVGPFWKLFSLYCIRVGCWGTLYSEDNRKPEDCTYPPHGLYIANHQGFLDIPIVLSQFQVPPIMKKEVLYIPILGVMAWAAGALVVSRGKRNSRKKVFVKARKRLVDDNFAVQYYPEGTRSKTAIPKEYKDLKITLLQLAWEAKVPVFPISIYGTRGVISKWGIIRPGHKFGIITSSAVNPNDFDNPNSFAKACWEKVTSGHSKLSSLLGS